MIFFWILFVLSTYFLYINIKSGKILSPMFMLSLSTFTSIFTLIFGFLEYENYMTPQNGYILISFYFAFFLGSRFKNKKFNINLQNNYALIQLNVFYKFSFRILFLFIVVGIILRIENLIFVTSNITRGNFISLAKSLATYDQDKIGGIINLLKSISSSAFLILSSILFTPRAYKDQLPKYLIFFSYLSFICITLDTLGLGKRSNIIFSILIGLILRFQINYLLNKSSLNFKKVRRFIFIGLISSFIVLGVFPTMKNPDLTRGILNYVNDVDNREFSDFAINNFVDNPNPLLSSMPAYIVGSSYLHTGFMKFNYFLTNNALEIDGNGLYNFNYLEKIIPLNKKSKYKEVSEKLQSISESDGFNSNPWASAFRDLIIDFGIFGSFIFILIFSFVSNNIFLKYYSKSINGKNILLSTFLLFFCFMLPFTSPFRVMILGQTLFVILIILIFLRIHNSLNRV